jgi:hypothetical protein
VVLGTVLGGAGPSVPQHVHHSSAPLSWVTALHHSGASIIALHNFPTCLPACRGTWREETFKEYNFNALGLPPAGGHLHPLLKVGTGDC